MGTSLKKLATFFVFFVAASNVIIADEAATDEESMIKKIVMTREAAGPDHPNLQARSFTPNDTFHAVVSVADAPAGTKVKAMWYVIDVGQEVAPNSLIDSFEITIDGTKDVDFSLKPGKAWPKGKYRVDILVDGEEEDTEIFTVE